MNSIGKVIKPQVTRNCAYREKHGDVTYAVVPSFMEDEDAAFLGDLEDKGESRNWESIIVPYLWLAGYCAPAGQVSVRHKANTVYEAMWRTAGCHED